MAGYLWSTDTAPAVDSCYGYNSTGGTVTVTTTSTGFYQATFGGLGSVVGSAIVQVSDYGDSATCAVGGWVAAAGNLMASVYCFGISSGLPVDTYFDLVVTRPTAVPHGTFDYSYVYKNPGTLSAISTTRRGRRTRSPTPTPAGTSSPSAARRAPAPTARSRVRARTPGPAGSPLPAAAGEDGQSLTVEETNRVDLRGIEVTVGIEPDHAHVPGLIPQAQATYASERAGIAVAGQHLGEYPVLQCRAHLIGHAAHELEVRHGRRGMRSCVRER